MLVPFLLGAIQIVLYFIYPTTPPIYAEQQSDTFSGSPSSTENVKSRKTRLEELKRRKREKEVQDEENVRKFS